MSPKSRQHETIARVSSNKQFSDTGANSNDCFDLLTPLKAHEYCNYVYARLADRQAVPGARERRGMSQKGGMRNTVA